MRFSPSKRLFIPALLLLLTLTACAPKNGNKLLKNTKQDANVYVTLPQNQVLINKDKQAASSKTYLGHFFSPWGEDLTSEILPHDVWKHEYTEFTHFFKHPGYAENKHPLSVELLNNIKYNLQLPEFRLNKIKAITIAQADVRRLPTDKPSFKNFKNPGDGYPFDRLQDSVMGANTPILVLAQSRDKAWSLVRNHFIMGWIKSSQLAFVNDVFIKEWRTKKYATPIQRHFPLVNRNSLFQSNARIGSILPILKDDQDKWTVLIANRNKFDQAVIVQTVVPKNMMAAWPLEATVGNFTQLINNLLGEPYGWGGMYGYRDCSATLQDVYASFGIWLPRSSAEQAKAGDFISFKGLSSAHKIANIQKQAKPLMTLIGIRGHIMLYLGMHDHKPYVFQNVWGIHTHRIGRSEGRVVIGKAVITPIDLGEAYWDVKGKTFLDRAFGMTLLR